MSETPVRDRGPQYNGAMFERMAHRVLDADNNLVGYFISADDWRIVRGSITRIIRYQMGEAAKRRKGGQ